MNSNNLNPITDKFLNLNLNTNLLKLINNKY